MALITVSGTLKDPSGAATAGSVTFQLANYGANIPRVIGTNSVVATFISFTANASGAWTGSIQGNDSIDPGAANTPPTTFYEVSFKDVAGNTIATLPFQFTGAGPANLDSQAPLNVVPSPTTPPNNAALLGANQTFTGNNTFNGTTTINNGILIGNLTETGDISFTESAAPSGAGGSDLLWGDSTAHRLKMNNNNVGADTVVGAATTDTLTNKTLTSPVINGTPTGTGIPTTVFAKGSGGGTYTTTSASYTDIDVANLTSGALTIPTGWKAVVTLVLFGNAATSSTNGGFAIADSTTTLIDSIVQSDSVNKTTTLRWVFTGDGASHTFKARFKNDGTHSTAAVNTSTQVPTLDVVMYPSN